MITYRKAWKAKQKAIERVYSSWEDPYEELPRWLEALCASNRHARVEFETMSAYHGNELVPNIRIFNKMFWTFGPYRRAFRHCKLLV